MITDYVTVVCRSSLKRKRIAFSPQMQHYMSSNMRVWKQTYRLLFLAIVLATGIPAIAFAAQSASPHYQVNEVFFGSGGELNACSTSYCSKQSLGETAVGNTASTNYQAQGGFNTDRTPYIQFIVNNTTQNLGTLTPSGTTTATASFSVKAYLAHGYAVINASDPPSNNTYTMQTPATPTASTIGTEQFGINLVANTSPTILGADPVQDPGSLFSYGQVSTDYNTPNLYKYTKGDVVALSTSSSSDTVYTVSYIFNISHVTPGGQYLMRHVLVATGTY
jgi:hypothetical protein